MRLEDRPGPAMPGRTAVRQMRRYFLSVTFSTET